MNSDRIVSCTKPRFSKVPIPYVLVVLHGIIMCSVVSSRIFLSNYIAQSSGALALVGFYYLVLFSGQTATFALGARWCKERSFLSIIRIGLFGNALFFMVLGVLGESLVDYLLPLAFMHGIVQGLYWLPAVQYGIEFSKPKRRARFFAALAVTAQIVGILIPLVFGYIIAHEGSYQLLFYSLSGIFILGTLLVVVFMVPNKGKRGVYHLPSMVKILKTHRESRQLLIVFFILGLTIWGAMELMMPLLVYRETGSALTLGIVASILPGVEILSSMLAGRIKQEWLSRMLLLSGITMFLGVLAAVWVVELSTIVIYAVAFSLVVPAVSVLINTLGAEIIKEVPELATLQTEFIVMREIALGFGRVLGYGGFIIITGITQTAYPLRMALLVFGCAAAFGIIVYLRKIVHVLRD
jgi:YQGE family putative transporter